MEDYRILGREANMNINMNKARKKISYPTIVIMEPSLYDLSESCHVNTKITFQLENNMSELDTLMCHLDQFFHGRALPTKTICQVELAMEEVFTNMISYGYTDHAVHQIKITLSCNNELLIMEMEDDGIPFNPLSIKKPNISCPIESREQGGLGFYLVRQYMDDIAYFRSPIKNHLVMKKRIEMKRKNDALSEHGLRETETQTV